MSHALLGSFQLNSSSLFFHEPPFLQSMVGNPFTIKFIFGGFRFYLPAFSMKYLSAPTIINNVAKPEEPQPLRVLCVYCQGVLIDGRVFCQYKGGMWIPGVSVTAANTTERDESNLLLALRPSDGLGC